MTAACPSCSSPQDSGLLCHTCTTRLEQELSSVRGLVDDLLISLSKQAKIGAGGGSAGLARERTPVNWGASEQLDNLTNVLTTWARDVAGDHAWVGSGANGAVTAGWVLLARIDAIRRHPAVNELTDEIGDAVQQARRAIDRPLERVFVGPCRAVVVGEHGDEYQCATDLYARVGAAQVACRVCGAVTGVVEQRAWLLAQAADRLFTVREAAQMIGDNGGIRVTESSIRGLIHRERLAYRPHTKLLRLGDLLDVLVDMRAEKVA